MAPAIVDDELVGGPGPQSILGRKPSFMPSLFGMKGAWGPDIAFTPFDGDGIGSLHRSGAPQKLRIYRQNR